MPLKHGPIEGIKEAKRSIGPGVVFHAPKAWPH